MVYWTTQSITSSLRLYYETLKDHPPPKEARFQSSTLFDLHLFWAPKYVNVGKRVPFWVSTGNLGEEGFTAAASANQRAGAYGSLMGTL